MNIVSLIASATEIVCALGARDQLCGRSHECDRPADVIGVPPLTKPRFDTKGSSRSIDTAVRDLVGDGLSVYDIDRDTLAALEPDVILTQDQCEVCAASLDDVTAALRDFAGRDINVISLRPDTLADVLADIRRVGNAIGRSNAAEDLTTRMTDDLDALRTKYGGRGTRPKAFLLEWIDPPMAAGHWIPPLIEAAGGENVVTREGAPSGYVEWSTIAEADPDVIIVAPCGFDVDRTAKELHGLSAQPEWTGLRAVKAGKVAVMDGNRFINRPSPGVVESAAMIHDVLWNGAPARGPAYWRWHHEFV